MTVFSCAAASSCAAAVKRTDIQKVEDRLSMVKETREVLTVVTTKRPSSNTVHQVMQKTSVHD